MEMINPFNALSLEEQDNPDSASSTMSSNNSTSNRSKKKGKGKGILSPDQIDFVIYHKDCPDGFASAWCAWKLLGNRAKYFAAKHGDTPPNVGGKHVAVFDFSYPRKQVENMIQTSKGFILWDHHKSAMEALEGVPHTHFNMDKSGARLAWEYFHRGKPPPTFIQYIEDKDLWRWQFKDSKPFSAFLDTVTQTFEEYDKFLDESYLSSVLVRGQIILEYSEVCIQRLATRAVLKKLKGHPVFVINSPLWHSELGNLLASKPECKFAVVWAFDHHDHSSHVSLRGTRDDVDLSAIASRYGGGGHPRAAGFKWKKSIENLFDKEEPSN